MKKLVILLANGFGLGNSPHCSGTVGALLGIPFGIALTALHGHVWAQIAIAYAMALLAVPICGIAERHYGRKDDGRVVADEWMLLPICFIGQEPVWRELADGDWVTAVLFTGMAFAVSRISDIVKAFPAYQLQKMEGGLGIMLDDFFASVYAWVAIYFLNGSVLQPHVVPFAKNLLGAC